jgi:hypothetical protein
VLPREKLGRREGIKGHGETTEPFNESVLSYARQLRDSEVAKGLKMLNIPNTVALQPEAMSFPDDADFFDLFAESRSLRIVARLAARWDCDCRRLPRH